MQCVSRVLQVQQPDLSRRGGRLSSVWIIPLLAVLLGAYMLVHNWMTEGPSIEIVFETAEGLQPGKTKIKYRNVDMGLVETVRLDDDFRHVVAQARLDRRALPLLREDTQFWVVTARVGADQITGLGTLVSGAYIALAPGEGAEGWRRFDALDRPPLTPPDAPGLRLLLWSDRANSVTAGDVVLYNGYEVGRVESRDFDLARGKVRYVAFIDAPFHTLLHSSVRFWNVSGVEASLNAEGVSLQTGSLDTLLFGGVAFGAPPGMSEGEPVSSGEEFQLFPSYQAALDNPFRVGRDFVLSFDQGVRGLSPGAPVEYRGIKVGEVQRILLREASEDFAARGLDARIPPVPVLVRLEPGRLDLPDRESSSESLLRSIAHGVTKGLRATMETGSLLTGARYISLDYFPNQPRAELDSWQGYPSIPTLTTGLGQIQQRAVALLEKLDALPLEHTVEELNAVMRVLNTTTVSLNSLLQQPELQRLPAELAQTLSGLRAALEGLSPDSELYRSLDASLRRLDQTLGNIEALSSTLAEQPNAIIVPSAARPDPIPQVQQR